MGLQAPFVETLLQSWGDGPVPSFEDLVAHPLSTHML
jgi:hypothetical protein